MTLAVANTPASTEAPSCDFDGHVSDWLNIVAISLKLIGNVFVESVSLNMLISILADEFEHESKGGLVFTHHSQHRQICLNIDSMQKTDVFGASENLLIFHCEQPVVQHL